MIRINLLPIRVSRRQEAVKRELIFGGIGLGIIVVLCLLMIVIVLARTSEVISDNTRLNQELENLKAVVARVDEIEKFNEELRRKLAVIGGLKSNKVGPVHMLDELSVATPEKLYLTNLKEKEKKITLVGYAASNEVISQYLINLEKSDWFDEVYLISISTTEVNGFTLKSFEITANMVVPEAEGPNPNAPAEKPLQDAAAAVEGAGQDLTSGASQAGAKANAAANPE